MNTPVRKKTFRAKKSSLHGLNIFRFFGNWKQRRNIGIGHFLVKSIGIVILLGTLGVIGIAFAFMRGVPDIGSIERGDYFQESTIIYDKTEKPIYTLFTDGKRTYIGNQEISNDIKNAIVSTEDKTFFENPGFDIKGLIRAGYNYISGKTDRIKGTSTLSQQLISYTLLSKERSIKRKVQEAYLSYMLNKSYSKEKILEMYLNTISYGYNANGVEEASKTFFGKSAKDVGPLGASILASLPKGPTYYSPYIHRDRLIGEAYVYSLDDPESKISLYNEENRKTYKNVYTKFKSYLSGITLDVDGNDVIICGIQKEYVRNSDFFPNNKGCVDTNYDNILNFLGDIYIKEDITLSGSTSSYALEYAIGRKDFVASRMFEDGKIDGFTMKKIVYDGLEFQFLKYTENIRYPYFVMYIKEYLESKYGKDIDITKGLKVYTTLDPNLQDKAESLVKKQVAINKNQYGAKSAALVSMNNTNGALLAMVGGPDYFDLENGGNNNMILARRQPGSSFKPFVYALALSKQPIGPESPVADAKTSFGPWTPDNYDKRFDGVMTISRALSYSRNIPAVKMFYLAGKEESIVKLAQSFGLNSIKENAGYGAPLAIGTAEVRPIDLMQAYSVLANLGVKKELYSIIKIIDSDGNIVEEHKDETSEPIFSPAASYILNTILASPENRPEGFWRNAITLSGGRKVAAKTGTSNKDVSEGGTKKILPRDLWTAGYSPEITTVVWAGNVDGKETKGSCDGLNCAAGIWKPFMEYALKDSLKTEWKKPDGIYDVTIVKLSGRLATKDTPDEQKVNTMMAVKPTKFDGGMKEERVDTLCNGPITDATPESAIGSIFIPIASPIVDGFELSWKSGFYSSLLSSSGRITQSDVPCVRPDSKGDIDINIKLIGSQGAQVTGLRRTLEASWNGNRSIKIARIILDNETKLQEQKESTGSENGIIKGNIVLEPGDNTLVIELVDIYGFSYVKKIIYTTTDGAVVERNVDGTISGTDLSTPIIETVTNEVKNPSILVNNPKSGNVSLYSGNPINLRFSIDVVPGIREVNVSFSGKRIYTATNGDIFVVPIDTTGFEPGEYSVKISVIDTNLKTIEKTLTITILPR